MPTDRKRPRKASTKKRDQRDCALPASGATEAALAESEKRCRALAEENLALRHSEKRLQQLLESAFDWFWETDAKGDLTYISSNHERLLGRPVSEFIGKRFTALPGVSISPEMAEKFRAAARARQAFNDFVYSHELTAGGKKRWININCVPVFAESGEFRGYRGSSRDITARVEAEQALRESEQRFRRLFEIGADYYWEIDAQHRLSFVAPEAAHDAIYGVPLSTLLGKRMTDTLAVSFDPESGRRALLAQKTRQAYRDLIFSVKRPTGEVRWISVSGAPRFGEDGTFLGFHGIGADITARRDAEAAARLAQRQLHDAVAYVTQPFVVFDAGDRATAFNQAFTDLFRMPGVNTPVHDGASVQELAEWQVRMKFHADGPDDRPVDVGALLAHHQTEDEQAYHLHDDRWMLVVHRRLPGGGCVGLWTDVTAIKRAEAERRQLEDQLHHSQRLEALGTLAGGIAHEINNALVPVLALTKMMAKKTPADSRDRRNLDVVTSAAERSRDLVAQILAFSRKGPRQRHAPIDVGVVVRDAIRFLHATLPASIRIEETISETPPLEGDAAKLQQVVVNLMTNAAHAIGDGMGTIGVRLEPSADGMRLRLSVSDSGCGID